MKNRDVTSTIFRRHDAFLMWVVLVMATGAMLFAVRTFSTNNKWLYLSFNPEANHTVSIKVRNAPNCSLEKKRQEAPFMILLSLHKK